MKSEIKFKHSCSKGCKEPSARCGYCLMQPIEDRFCFICNADLRNKVKVISYYHYPDIGEKDDNGPMCQPCAKKDLDIAHKQSMDGIELKEVSGKVREELNCYHKLFGRFYIKI